MYNLLSEWNSHLYPKSLKQGQEEAQHFLCHIYKEGDSGVLSVNLHQILYYYIESLFSMTVDNEHCTAATNHSLMRLGVLQGRNT